MSKPQGYARFFPVGLYGLLLGCLCLLAAPRLGQPVDQARVIAFLASEDADFVTGQTIQVNGGM